MSSLTGTIDICDKKNQHANAHVSLLPPTQYTPTKILNNATPSPHCPNLEFVDEFLELLWDGTDGITGIESNGFRP